MTPEGPVQLAWHGRQRRRLRRLSVIIAVCGLTVVGIPLLTVVGPGRYSFGISRRYRTGLPWKKVISSLR